MLRLVLLPLLAPLFLAAYGWIFLTTTAATTTKFIPFAFVAGPVGLVGLLLLGLTTRPLLLLVMLAGAYALYLLYGLVLLFWANRRRSISPPLTWILVVHVVCVVAFMLLSLFKR